MARIDDGWQTLITFANAPSIALLFAEKSVTPPGIDGGGLNDTTTMRNSVWRTGAPKNLKTLSESGFECSYDPAVLDDILTMINDNQLITITFPDGSSWDFWGFLNSFKPNPVVEGQQATAVCQLLPTNQNADGVETAPVHNEA